MKKIYIFLIVLLVLMIGAGAFLLIWELRSEETFVIDVEFAQEGITEKALTFTAENFLPGETREYTVNVRCEEAGEFHVEFSCVSKGEGTLWEYLNIEISCGDNKNEIKFADMYNGEILSLDISLNADETTGITVRYKLPADVGNEAMKQSADFVLLVKAERK